MTRLVATLALFLVVFSATNIATAATEPRVALVIGNGGYAEAPLTNPVNDARLMAETLRGLGFDVIERTDADSREMKLAIFELGDRLEAAGKEAVGLFYYAGHGVQVNGQNYLIPLGAEITKERHVAIEAVGASWVLGQMEFVGNRVNFIILDACRNNPLTRGFRSQVRGLAKMNAPTGSLVAYSTGPGDVAVDGDGTNSPYTLALAEVMQMPNLPAEKVFKLVRDAVREATKGEQTPWEESSMTGEDFYFSVAEPVAVEAPISLSSIDVAEQAFWQAIKDSASADDYLAYLDAYPDGVYAALARSRADALRAASASQAAQDTSVSDLAFWTPSRTARTRPTTRPICNSFPMAHLLRWPRRGRPRPRRVHGKRPRQRCCGRPRRVHRKRPSRNSGGPSRPNGQAEDYQAYISAYPVGKFTEVARVRMLTLAQSKRAAEQAESQVASLDPEEQVAPTPSIAAGLGTYDGDWVIEVTSPNRSSQSDIVKLEIIDGRFKVEVRIPRRSATITGEIDASGRLSAKGVARSYRWIFSAPYIDGSFQSVAKSIPDLVGGRSDGITNHIDPSVPLRIAARDGRAGTSGGKILDADLGLRVTRTLP